MDVIRFETFSYLNQKCQTDAKSMLKFFIIKIFSIMMLFISDVCFVILFPNTFCKFNAGHVKCKRRDLSSLEKYA